MIFATIGTSEPFDRLLTALADLEHADELVIQCGSSSFRPAGATCVDYLEYAQLVELVRNATVVVMHAGAGSVLTALTNGKMPVVVPRLAQLGEAVDDHQVPFARRMDEAGFVLAVENLCDLPGAIQRVAGVNRVPSAVDSPLPGELRAFIAAAVASPRRCTVLPVG